MRRTTAILSVLITSLAAGLAAENGSGPQVTYIANDGFLVEHGGKKVLIDALFDAAAMPPPGADLLLVTHPHSDHFNPKLAAAYLRDNPRTELLADKQTAGLLREEPGFAQIRDRIHELQLEPGTDRRLTVNGIAVDALCLKHMRMDTANLAFVVNLGGTRFLHMGDAMVEDNLPHLRAYAFDQTPVDVLFLNRLDRSPASREFIGRKIKPSRIVAMHIPPAELAEELKKVWAAYPFAIVFRKSMEQRSLPIEADFHHLTGDYFGQPAPGATPQVFARGIVSSDLQEHGVPAFSPDGNELFWSSNRKPGPDNEDWIGAALTMRRENGRWSAPYVPSLSRPPVFSGDGRRAYFSAPRPGAAQQTQPNSDLWFVERQGDGWSEPRCLNLVARYPELRFIYASTIARSGAMYFLAYTPGPLNGYGIYRSEFVNGEYAKPELLPRSINLPPFLNWTPFIAPDESYLLFSSNRRDPGHDAGDLYVARRLADGNWTDPVSLGEPVNTSHQERFPTISNDGKYLFFSRQTPDHDEDVFWMEAAAVPALRAVTDAAEKNLK